MGLIKRHPNVNKMGSVHKTAIANPGFPRKGPQPKFSCKLHENERKRAGTSPKSANGKIVQ